MEPLILGSQSPRRKEILEFFDIPFIQRNSDFDENSIAFENDDPITYVKSLAYNKALALQEKYPNNLLLTADTVVYFNHKVYNKPINATEAFNFLTELSGQWHSVFTAVCVIHQNQATLDYEETKVLFNPLTAEEIRHYHSKIDWVDKAAGYAIQLGGGLIVKKIEGCYYNVLGFPINTVRKLLKNTGIDLWTYVK